jgi:hypothetical protein
MIRKFDKRGQSGRNLPLVVENLKHLRFPGS